MLTLVLGGVRSGKSAVAEARADAAAAGQSVCYVATGPRGHGLEDRIAVHRARRPDTWTTIEPRPADLATSLGVDSVVLLDSLGTWVSSVDDFAVDIDALVDALTDRRQPTIVVSEEVGLGVHPPTEIGRRFADALGLLNQRVAAVADTVVLVVAGRSLEL